MVPQPHADTNSSKSAVSTCQAGLWTSMHTRQARVGISVTGQVPYVSTSTRNIDGPKPSMQTSES